ncbi:MAG: acireductone synthase [Planctomycetales bacterium]|nr:acireductone synthase [Planctomycetales bacterium]
MNMSPKGILLDIEGTTSSISFVHDVMFPHVLQKLDMFLDEQSHRPDVQQACNLIAVDAGFVSAQEWSDQTSVAPLDLIRDEVRRLMAADVKATGLKALQGLIWEGGFLSKELVAHVYPDVVPALHRWRDAGKDVRIYSSGSIAAQKLFFGHLADHGDCLSLFSGHYDTTIGGKKQASSYQAIAEDWKLNPAEILFVSDIADELQAARVAGMRALASVRPGNAPLPVPFDIPQIKSFDEIE